MGNKIKMAVTVTMLLSLIWSFNCKVKAVETIDGSNILEKIIIDANPIRQIGNITFKYDSNYNRIEKNNGDNITKYYYVDGKLVCEKGKNTIVFLYENDRCISEIINGDTYDLVYNEYGDVIAIYSGDECVCKYNYNGTESIIVYSSNSIAEINPLRYNGLYLDKETNCYYLDDGIFYSIEDSQYIQNEPVFDMTVLESEPTIIRVIVQAYEMYMNYSTSFGTESYDNVTQAQWNAGQRWYDGIGAVELLARCIYAENDGDGLVGKNNRIAIATVIMNRVAEAWTSASTAYSAITYPSMFSTINPNNYTDSNSETFRARRMIVKTDERYKQAVMLACAAYYTSNRAELGYIYTLPTYINNQTYFYSFRSACNQNAITTDGTNVKLWSSIINNVCLPGAVQISASNLSSVISGYSTAGHNVFYRK